MEKKLFWHSTLGKISIVQQVFRSKAEGKTYCPFLAQAKITACGCSLLLCRRLVDFSSERSMERTSEALKEHYGIDISASIINKITQEIGAEAKVFNAEVSAPAKPAKQLIVEIDGSMVPIVNYGKVSEEEKAKGKKRKRECSWKEFRLCTANRQGEVKIRYGVTDGSTFEAGCMMYQNAKAEGMDEKTHIHGVGDGAPWIAEQYEEQFGANHSFLIDFYHVGEYMAAAAKEVCEEDGGKKTYREWKDKLLAGGSKEIIAELSELHRANPGKEGLANCLRYLENRSDNLDYAKALKEGLPIGSGAVESGHRSVLQKRLKQTGAWWKKTNAESMAQIKTLQANGDWDHLWKKLAA